MRSQHLKRLIPLILLLALLQPIQRIHSEGDNLLKPFAMLGRGYVNDMAWSPDGATLAIATSVGVWLYNTAHFDVEPRLIEGYSAGVWFSPDSIFIATNTPRDQLRVFYVA